MCRSLNHMTVDAIPSSRQIMGLGNSPGTEYLRIWPSGPSTNIGSRPNALPTSSARVLMDTSSFGYLKILLNYCFCS